MNKITIHSLNMRGGRDVWKRRSVFEYLKNLKANFILLQECHILEDDFKNWEEERGEGKIFINPFTARSAGQVILLKDKMSYVEHKIFLEGRIHLLKVTINEFKITIVNVYGPNKEKERRPFLDKLQTIFTNFDYGDFLIIGGDFNIVQDPKKDKFSNKAQLCKAEDDLKSRTTFKQFKEKHNLIDIWRLQNQNTKRYTWSQPNPSVKCRLDFFLITNNLLKFVKSSKILPSIRSDHSLIELNIRTEGPKRGPGTWKLNTSLLNDEEYKQKIKSLITEIWDTSSGILDLGLRSDWLKYKIRQFSIEYGKQRTKIGGNAN